VKLGQHRSSETTLEVGVPQGSVLGPLMFTVYCSTVADVIASHGVRCHQYADDTQLQLAMRVDNTAAGSSILAACTTDVKQWYMQNGLQLNPDKSEALFMGTATQLRAVTSLTSVSVADVDLSVADSIRVLGVTLDRRLTSDNHASAVAIVQLPCTCDPPHTPSTDDGLSTDACIQPDSLENRLLQLCAVRRSTRHHSEAPASLEQRGAYRSTSASTVRRQLATSDAALAAC